MYNMDEKMHSLSLRGFFTYSCQLHDFAKLHVSIEFFDHQNVAILP